MKILLIPFFIVSFFTAANAAIMEKCSYETDDLWIKIINLCEEGEMSCDKMVYIGLNKKTGDYITLSGKSVISKSNYNFWLCHNKQLINSHFYRGALKLPYKLEVV